jgi:hypothetical protein
MSKKNKELERRVEILEEEVKQLSCPHTRTSLTEMWGIYSDEDKVLYTEVCDDCKKTLRTLTKEEYYIARKEKAEQKIKEGREEIQEMKQKLEEYKKKH